MNNICIILKTNLLSGCFCLVFMLDTHPCMSGVAPNGEEIGDPCMTRCFLCQMCHLTLTENWNTWQKMAKIGSARSFGCANKY